MRSVVVPLVLFGILITVAALVYPGGSFQGASAGYSFWHNFWCDLLSARALNGESNVAGSVLSRIAFACFAMALQRFWPLAIALAGRSLAATIAERLGVFGAASLLIVAVVPAATSQLIHGVAVVVSAGCSILGVILLMRGLLRRREHIAASLGAAVTLTTIVCLAQYIYQGLGDTGAATWLAGMQKITTVFLLAFMLQLTSRHQSQLSLPR